MILDYKKAKEKLLTELDTDCQQFFVKKGYILENAYFELLSDNLEKAKNLFNAIKQNDIRAHWASFMISMIEADIREYPSYFELRNFLEIDLNILINYFKGDYVEKIVRYANKIGLEYITVYAFSTENWKRAEDEVKTLMLLLQAYLDDYAKRADSENIKVKILGDITALSKGMQKSIRECMERTKNNTGVTFNIALNYGGRDEIVKATRKIAEQVKQGKIDVDEINEKMVSDNLYTAGEPDPDLVIRTSGEIRLSGFLPWQSVYSELLFVNKNWPDFTENDLDEAIIEYQKRTRKFGAN
mgnify:CR=1 FL=1